MRKTNQRCDIYIYICIVRYKNTRTHTCASALDGLTIRSLCFVSGWTKERVLYIRLLNVNMTMYDYILQLFQVGSSVSRKEAKRTY